MILALGMAWTADEIAQIRAAVLALVTGTRVASVSYAGPPARSVSYQAADLPTLRSMLAEAEGASRAGYRLATTRKGV